MVQTIVLIILLFWTFYTVEMLNGRLNTVSATVDTTSSSLSTMRSEWTEFIQNLPALRTMYNEVKMIIDLLPKGMWDTVVI